jgi:hypothetical protein
MAHFAKIENNIVTDVLVVSNDLEHRGADYLANDLGLGGTWIQTSYNGTIRFNFAGIGYTYDPVDDAFIAPSPNCGHNELLLNELKKWECTNDEHVVVNGD